MTKNEIMEAVGDEASYGNSWTVPPEDRATVKELVLEGELVWVDHDEVELSPSMTGAYQ